MITSILGEVTLGLRATNPSERQLPYGGQFETYRPNSGLAWPVNLNGFVQKGGLRKTLPN
jgi:hypothetical protein